MYENNTARSTGTEEDVPTQDASNSRHADGTVTEFDSKSLSDGIGSPVNGGELYYPLQKPEGINNGGPETNGNITLKGSLAEIGGVGMRRSFWLQYREQTYDEMSNQLGNLTAQERSILEKLATLTIVQIADQLSVEPGTVHSHLSRIYRKLDVDDKNAAIIWSRDYFLPEEDIEVDIELAKIKFTSREEEAIYLYALGYSIAEIAERLNLSNKVTKYVIGRINKKLKAEGRVQGVYSTRRFLEARKDYDKNKKVTDDLTDDERNTLVLLAMGHTMTKIAHILVRAQSTISERVSTIHTKLGVSSRAEAITLAIREGLVGEIKGTTSDTDPYTLEGDEVKSTIPAHHNGSGKTSTSIDIIAESNMKKMNEDAYALADDHTKPTVDFKRSMRLRLDCGNLEHGVGNWICKLLITRKLNGQPRGSRPSSPSFEQLNGVTPDTLMDLGLLKRKDIIRGKLNTAGWITGMLLMNEYMQNIVLENPPMAREVVYELTNEYLVALGYAALK